MNKTRKTQRKKPKQTRSKALVDSIYQATVRILPRIGVDGLTTKKVAETAGVSIGSLYQYFPNKDSILEAVMDMAISTTTASVNKAVDQLGTMTMEQSVSLMVDHVLGVFLDDKLRMREVFKRAPELQRVPILYYTRQKVVERLAAHAERKMPGLPSEDYKTMAFISANAAMGVVQTMLFDETQTYSKDELAAELKIMIVAYLLAKSRPQTEVRSRKTK
ncbi:MAG: TetR/AcrR family transcriptional regulator [Bdellovibrionales bacterium]